MLSKNRAMKSITRICTNRILLYLHLEWSVGFTGAWVN